MTAYLRLVVQSAERHSHIFALHGSRNALAETRLAHSRRTIKAQYRGLHIPTEFQHGHVFEYAFLYLLHAIVVVVEHFLRSFEVEVVFCIFVPWQVDHRLQIVELHAELRALRIEHLELVQFLVEHLGNLFRPFLCLGSFLQLVILR